MKFEKNYIYHIFNQGNNKRKIFFNHENYLFFLYRIKTYVTPYADILAWCLMPNHFHLMMLIREVEIDINRINKLTSYYPVSKMRTLNQSIAILLRSYTRAINIQENFSGALFRESTKAECINCPDIIAPSFFINKGMTIINIRNPEREYLQICFNYIHQNPVKAGLAKKEIDWEFSSAIDYAGMRNGKLVNKKVASKYVIF